MRHLWIALFCMGCSPIAPLTHQVRDRATVFQEEFKQFALQPAPDPLESTVERLSVRRDGEQWMVSIRCQRAPIRPLLERLFRLTHQEFLFQEQDLSSWVEASFDELPLRQAIELICASAGLRSSLLHGGPGPWWIRAEPTAADSDSLHSFAAPEPIITTSIPFLHRSPLTVQPSLQSLLTAIPGMRAAVAPHGSLLTSSGPASSCALLRRLCRAMDVASPIISFEVFLVAMVDSLVESFSLGLSQGQWGPWRDVILRNSVVSGGATDITKSGYIQGALDSTADSPPQFLLELIAAIERRQALFLTRYDAFASNRQPVELSSGRIGYLLSPAYAAGFSYGTNIKVEANSRFTCTPQVVGSGEIRCLLDASAAFLANNSFGLVGYTTGRAFKSVVQVRSGQPFLAVSFRSDVSQETTSGYPIPEGAPLLSRLLRAMQSGYQAVHIMTIVVPRLIDRPRLEPSAGLQIVPLYVGDELTPPKDL